MLESLTYKPSLFSSFRLCIKDRDKRWQAKASNMCGLKLCFQLAKHPLIRSVHLSGTSPAAAPRAKALPYFLSGLRLFSDPDSGQSLPLSILCPAEETRNTEAGSALLQPTHSVYIQWINTNIVGEYEILPSAWPQGRLPLTSHTHTHTHMPTHTNYTNQGVKDTVVCHCWGFFRLKPY